MSIVSCVFCEATSLQASRPDSYHPVIRDFGPFDLAKCPNCRSWNTLNPPTEATLAGFYANYEASRPEHYIWAEKSGALARQYVDYMRRVLAFAPEASDFTWADVGAGKGEVANNLHAAKPDAKGTAFDIAPRPAGLAAGIDHKSLDLNASTWAAPYERQFDLVYSVAVWEHVLRPLEFLASCLALVRRGGTLVMICPNGDSLAGALMGTKWPYWEPGEHLFIPSPKGGLACAKRAAKRIGLSEGGYKAASRAIPVAYSLRYALVAAGLGRLTFAVPQSASLPLPTGILMTSIRVV